MIFNPALTYEILCTRLDIDRITEKLVVDITAVVEYLFFDILARAVSEVNHASRKRVCKEDIISAIFYDDELCTIFRSIVIHANEDGSQKFRQQFIKLLAQAEPGFELSLCAKTILVKMYKRLLNVLADYIIAYSGDATIMINSMCDTILCTETASFAKRVVQEEHHDEDFANNFAKLRVKALKDSSARS